MGPDRGFRNMVCRGLLWEGPLFQVSTSTNLYRYTRVSPIIGGLGGWVCGGPSKQGDSIPGYTRGPPFTKMPGCSLEGLGVQGMRLLCKESKGLGLRA